MLLRAESFYLGVCVRAKGIGAETGSLRSPLPLALLSPVVRT